MRNALWVGVAVSGLALGVGCQNERKQVATQEQDLADARQDASKAEANTRRDAAQKKAEIDARAEKEIAKEQRDVTNAQKDLGEAQEKAIKEGEGIGGSGAVATAGTVIGILKSSLGNGLTVTEKSGAELELATDPQTRATLNGSAVKLDDFREGTPLRVSYETQGDKKLARSVTILAPTRK